MSCLTDAEPMAYIGRCVECGGIIAAATDEPRFADENADFIADLLRRGRRVERVTCQSIRDGLGGCSPDCPCLVCRKRRVAADLARLHAEEAELVESGSRRPEQEAAR